MTDLAPPEQATDLSRLLAAFGVLQMHHARVLHHESSTRGLNGTDVRFVFFLAAAAAAADAAPAAAAADAGPAGGGVTPKQAGEYLELSTGAMTSLIDRLVGRGHIERRPNPADRRSILLHLTPSGASVAEEIGARYDAAFSAEVPAELRAPLTDVFLRVGSALTDPAR